MASLSGRSTLRSHDGRNGLPHVPTTLRKVDPRCTCIPTICATLYGLRACDAPRKGHDERLNARSSSI